LIGVTPVGRAIAQQQGSGNSGMMGPGMMGPGMMSRGMMGWAGPQAMCNAMTSHIEGRLAFIKAELKITEAQEALWKAYAAAARDNGNAMATHCSTMMDQRGTSSVPLPERLDQHEQLMAAQLDTIRSMNKALKPLYAALDDGQRKVADELFWSHMGMMF